MRKELEPKVFDSNETKMYKLSQRIYYLEHDLEIALLRLNSCEKFHDNLQNEVNKLKEAKKE